MGRNYRLIPFTTYEVPQRYIDDKMYWPQVKSAMRVAACFCCGKKGENRVIVFTTAQWADHKDLPEDEDFLTKVTDEKEEVLVGVCQPCFDEKGGKAIQELQAKKKVVYSRKAHAKAVEEIKDAEQNRN